MNLVKKETFIVMMVIAVGFSLSFALYQYVAKQESERIAIEFENIISSYTVSLQQAIDNYQQSVRHFSHFSSTLLDKQQHAMLKRDLQIFTNDMDDIDSIAWYTASEKRELSNTSSSYYWPKTIIPNTENNNYDNTYITFSSGTYQPKNLTKKIIAYKKIPLISPVIPNYANDKNQTSKKPYGYLVAMLNTKKLLSNTLEAKLPNWLDIEIFYTNQQGQYIHLSHFSLDTSQTPIYHPDSAKSEHAIFLPGSLSINNINLSILYSPNDDEYFSYFAWQAIAIFIAGMVLTLILATYIFSQQKRNIKIQRIVEKRTKDLLTMTEELKKTQREQQVIFDSAPAQILYKDKENNILKINKQAADAIGKPVEFIEGKNANLFYPKDAQQHYQDDLNVIKTQRPKSGIIEQQHGKNGDLIWYSTTKVPYYNEQGEASGVIILATDITNLKNTEQALLESQERFELAVEGANDGIWDWPNINHDQQYWSPRLYELLGFEPEEIQAGASIFRSFLHPEDKEKVSIALRDHLSKQKPYNIEYRLKTKTGEYRWYRCKGIASRNESGTPYRITGSLSDIHQFKVAYSEKEKMEIQLQQAQKLESIGQLAAGIAHEINTPIQFVGDNVQFLKDSFTDIKKLLNLYDEKLALSNDKVDIDSIRNDIEEHKAEIDLDFILEESPTAFQHAKEGIEQVSVIVKSMKEFSHPGHKDKKYTNLNKSIQSTINVSRNEWKYIAELVTNFDESLPEVPCFPGELNQTILNMIINASHAIENAKQKNNSLQGQIKISTRKLENDVEIKVEDNGSGMNDATKEKIFDPFFTTKEVGKGTGQGLSIAYSVIVDKHSGHIKVDSYPGEGTTFSIQLPLTNDTNAEQTAENNLH